MRLAALPITAATLLFVAPAFAQSAAEVEMGRLAKCTTHLAALSVLFESAPNDQRLKPLAERMNPLLPRLGARFDTLRTSLGETKAQELSDKVFADAQADINAIVEAPDPAGKLIDSHGREIEACLAEIAKLPA